MKSRSIVIWWVVILVLSCMACFYGVGVTPRMDTGFVGQVGAGFAYSLLALDVLAALAFILLGLIAAWKLTFHEKGTIV
jgi:hypothetical protein